MYKPVSAWVLFWASLVAASPGLSQQPISGEQEPQLIALTAVDPTVETFLATHCVQCHSPESPEGDFDIASLSGKFTDRVEYARWLEIVNVLNSHQMPPEGEPQPDVDDVAVVVDWMTEQLTVADRRLAPQSAVLRRMNRNQYARTIRDLVGIDFDVSHFPLDATATGFDNNGAALSLSPLQIELYLESAQQVLDRILVHGE